MKNAIISPSRFVLFFVSFVLCCALITSKASATSYFIDPSIGNDTYTGTNWVVSGTSGPWRTLSKVNSVTFTAGDVIHFKANSAWTGQLKPQGSGTTSSPIIMGMYGTGNKPIINGAGLIGGTIELYNQQGWVIQDMEITNSAATAGIRSAIHVEAHDVGTLSHIYLQRLTIDNVTGQDGSRGNGGIILTVTGSTIQSKFDDIDVNSNLIHDVSRQGIIIDSTWINRSSGWNPSTNVSITNNFLYNIGGDGILNFGTSGAQIQYNVAHDCVNMITASGSAIWTAHSDNTQFASNEAYNTHFNPGKFDAQGFDIDLNTSGGIAEYNYSHDNGNGAMLIYAGTPAGQANTNTIVRYNIFQNNSLRELWSEGPHSNARIYNNTFYEKAGSTIKPVDIRDNPTNTQFKNNIFYNLGTGGYALGSGTGTVFDYNVFYGTVSTPSDAHILTSDPKLVSAGSGGIGLNTNDGYKLQTGSPALASGVLISGNGGSDYWGNSVSTTSAPNRGAYNGAAVTATNVAPTSTVTVSSQYNASYAGTKAVDGVIGVSGSGEWASLGELTPWIQLSWGSSQTINDIKLYDRSNLTDSIISGTLSFSDGSSITVGSLNNAGLAMDIPFSSKTVTWVKFTVTSGSGLNVGLSEIQVFN